MPEDPQQVAAVITVNDMYHELQRVSSGVQRLDLKLDTIPAQLTSLTAGQADHEASIRDLVKTCTIMRTQLRAAWAVLGVLIALASVYAAIVGN